MAAENPLSQAHDEQHGDFCHGSRVIPVVGVGGGEAGEDQERHALDAEPGDE